MNKANKETNLTHNAQSFEFDLFELSSVFWNSKYKIILVGFLFAILSAGYSLMIPNIYTSQAIIAPSDESSDSLSSLNQFSGLASIAGVSLPSSIAVDDSVKAMEVMKSLDFFTELASTEIIFYNLMASNGWDRNNNTLKIDSDIFNVQEKKWVSKIPNAENGKPSMQTAHRKFLKHFSISRDKTSGLIYVSYTHFSPYIAKDFIDLILLQIDKNFRNEAINNTNSAILYLKQEYDKNQISEIRLGISNLIQKNIEAATIANVSSNFLFKQVSKPYISELKSGPSRSIIVIISFILGSFICFFLIIAIKFYKQFNRNNYDL